jgi:hypothetical protein
VNRAASRDDVVWPDVWSDVASRLAAHRTAGRGHLLTEDVVRMETVLALGSAGVQASRLAVEHVAPELAGGKLDLVLDPPDGAVVELKYPRDSRTGFSPDTMTLGELVRDFLRVAAVPAEQRWVVQVLNPRLRRYLTGLAARHQLHWTLTEGDALELHPDVLAGLPETATTAIGRAALPDSVTAHCAVVAVVDDGLTLYGYLVEALPGATPPSSPAGSTSSPAHEPARTLPAIADRPRGARQEILRAVEAITTRSGRRTFTIAEVVVEMRGSRYAESTVRTMVSSHLCAQAQGPGVDSYTDLERVDRGMYRLRQT